MNRKNRLIICMLVCCWGICAAQDIKSVQHGKNIYRGLTVLTQSPTIQNVVMPANITACSSCHGISGQGKQEAGVVVPPITSKALLLPRSGGQAYLSIQDALSGLSHGGGRQHRQGRFELAANMPRYTFTPEEILDLTSYLAVLGTQNDDPPGVSANTIRIGTILPVENVIKKVGNEIEIGLKHEINSVNKRGGIFGRKIELLVQPLYGVSKADYTNALKSMSKMDIFALVGVWQPPLQFERQSELPLVGSLGLAATQLQARTQYFLMPSLEDQIKELLQLIAKECGSAPNELILLHNEHSATADAMLKIQFPEQSGTSVVQVDTASKVEIFIDPKFKKLVTLGVPIDNVKTFKNQMICVGQLATLSGLPVELEKASAKQLTLLPLPQSLTQTLDKPFWSTLGQLAVKLLADALSRSGRQLDDQSLQRVFETVDKFDLGSDIQIGFSRASTPGFRSFLMTNGGFHASSN